MTRRIIYLLVIALELRQDLVQSNQDSCQPPFANVSLVLMNLHNLYRHQYGGVQNLTYDPYLAAQCQKWANIMLQENNMHHGGNCSECGRSCGQNLWYQSGNEQSALSAWSTCMDSWMAEAKLYNFSADNLSLNEATGHFTQVVWKATSRVGCAKATSSDSLTTYICCNYFPPGNIAGEFPQNVLPL